MEGAHQTIRQNENRGQRAGARNVHSARLSQDVTLNGPNDTTKFGLHLPSIDRSIIVGNIPSQ